MAEPIILAFGRGELPEFPAAPDGVMDIIPVDLVVAAILAAAGTPPRAGAAGVPARVLRQPQPAAVPRCSTRTSAPTSRPTRWSCATAARSACPTWRFPGSRRVEGTLRAGERGDRRADRVGVDAAPVTRGCASARDEPRPQPRQAGVPAPLLRPLRPLHRRPRSSTATTALRQLERSLPADDRALLAVRPARSSTGALPRRGALPEHHRAAARGHAAPAPRRARPGRRPSCPAGTDVLAVFDLDGTLLSSNVVESYLWVRAGRPVPRRAGARARRGRRRPARLAAGRAARPWHVPALGLPALRRGLARRPRAPGRRGARDRRCSPAPFPPAIRRVREHRAAGHRTVLHHRGGRAVRPARCARCSTRSSPPGSRSTRDGRRTGYLAEPPLVGEARAAWLRHYAARARARPRRARTRYADGQSDLPLLRAVGQPGRGQPRPAAAPAWRTQAAGRSRTGRPRDAPRRAGHLAAVRGPPDCADPSSCTARCRATSPRGRVVGRLPGVAPPAARPAAARSTPRPAGARRRTAGPGCGPGCPASAGRTWRRSPGRSSFYFSPLVSLPFVPGHEVVGELLDEACADLPAGSRVVLDPVLSCAAARRARRAPPAAAGSAALRPRHRRARSPPACRPATAPTPAAAGAGSWSRTLPAARRARRPARRAGRPGRAARLRACTPRRRAAPTPATACSSSAPARSGCSPLLALRALTPAGAGHGGREARRPGRARAPASAPTEVRPARRRGRRRCAGVTRAVRLGRSAAARSCSAASTSRSTAPAAAAAVDTALRTTRAGGRVVLSGMPADRRRPDRRSGSASSSSSGPTPADRETSTGRARRSPRDGRPADLAAAGALARRSTTARPLAREAPSTTAHGTPGRLGTVKVASFDQRTAPEEHDA